MSYFSLFRYFFSQHTVYSIVLVFLLITRDLVTALKSNTFWCKRSMSTVLYSNVLGFAFRCRLLWKIHDVHRYYTCKAQWSLHCPTYRKARLLLATLALRSRNFGGRRSFFTSLMKVKVVLDHNGLKSGDLGRTETSLKSQTRARLFLITLDPDILAGWVVVANQGNQEIVTTLLRVTYAATWNSSAFLSQCYCKKS